MGPPYARGEECEMKEGEMRWARTRYRDGWTVSQVGVCAEVHSHEEADDGLQGTPYSVWYCTK